MDWEVTHREKESANVHKPFLRVRWAPWPERFSLERLSTFCWGIVSQGHSGHTGAVTAQLCDKHKATLALQVKQQPPSSVTWQQGEACSAPGESADTS